VRPSRNWMGASMSTDQEIAELKAQLLAHKAALKEAKSAFGADGPYPVFEVLEQAAVWLGHLSIIHNCDCQGHEVISRLRLQAQNQAWNLRAINATINSVLEKGDE